MVQQFHRKISFFTALCCISEYLLYNSTLVLLLNPVVPEQNKRRLHLYVIFHLDKSKIMLKATYRHECNHVWCEGCAGSPYMKVN